MIDVRNEKYLNIINTFPIPEKSKKFSSIFNSSLEVPNSVDYKVILKTKSLLLDALLVYLNSLSQVALKSISSLDRTFYEKQRYTHSKCQVVQDNRISDFIKKSAI